MARYPLMMYPRTSNRFHPYRRGTSIVTTNRTRSGARVHYNQGLPMSYTTVTRSNKRSGVDVTSQRDAKMQYRFKRAPRKVRRRMRRAGRKFKAQLLKNIGSNIAVKNEEMTINVSGAGQGYGAVHLYGTSGIDIGSIERGGADLNDIFSSDTRVATGESKLLFTTGILDVTLYANTLLEENPTDKMELDVYEVQYSDETKDTSFIGAMNTARPRIEVIPGFLNELNITTRGVSLFDFPGLTEQLGMRIVKKTKIFLSPGNFATYQIRDRKNYYVTKQDITDSVGFIKPYCTKGLVFVLKPVTGDAQQDVSLNVGITRRYNYKVVDGFKKYDGLIP